MDTVITKCGKCGAMWRSGQKHYCPGEVRDMPTRTIAQDDDVKDATDRLNAASDQTLKKAH